MKISEPARRADVTTKPAQDLLGVFVSPFT